MIRALIIVVLASLLAGCPGMGEAVTSAVAMEYPDEMVLPVPGDDESIVYFYSLDEFIPSSWIYENEERVGLVNPGAYTFLSVTPGMHEFSVYVGSRSAVILNTEAGGTYYVRYALEEGFISPKPQIEVVPKATGEATVPTLRYVKSKYH